MKLFSLLREDLLAARSQDPAATSTAEVALLYSGVHALWMYRLTHVLWQRPGTKGIARLLSQVTRTFTGIGIHPGASIGHRLFIDHGTGVVVGETAVIGDDVVIYQGVTLGGKATNEKMRHPSIGNRVMLGSGAKVLGPVTIGSDSAVGANAVVVTDIPGGAIAVGIPAHWRFRGAKEAVPRDVFIDPVLLT
ncbi:serine O-acetyltransferase [Arthrobacter rhizosphaerae]|uniref:serine O-acetyltransferase n=1 Tax=Arthrobacter rhizosphaerae TaxID=2855490 RepID=UPI001FF44DB7|nr:serine O-acetyltransferase [Arthrobacter rhizosphaerae]